LILLALVAVSIPAGYKRGAVIQVGGLVGLAVGVVIGSVLAPTVARLSVDRTLRAVVALGVLVTCAAAGNLIGTVVGTRVKKRTTGGKLFGKADSLAGALVSALALFLAVWFLALNLVNGPLPAVARAIRGSKIVAAIDAVMPQPPSLVGELRSVLNTLGFPDVFVGLPPVPAPPVPPPTQAEAKNAEEAAKGSTIKVLGDGCYTGFYDQGSGFVVAPGYIITNAHVVSGTSRQWVNQDRDYPATVVAFDPALDVAILHVPDLHDKTLPLASDEVSRGAVGAVLGFPAGGPLTGVKAAVGQTIDAVGRDIYGRGDITRRMYELQAKILPGNSGGPFVLENGRVAGLVFASSVATDQVGYAMVIGDLEPLIKRSVGKTSPVSTQSCSK
jgi:S1-C subfamily serine protease